MLLSVGEEQGRLALEEPEFPPERLLASSWALLDRLPGRVAVGARWSRSTTSWPATREAAAGAPGLPAPPALRTAVVTCMDARIDVYAALGLERGEAHVLRNAGGVVTDDVLRSLAISQRRLGTEAVVLIHHTRCGMEGLDEDALRAELTEAAGEPPPFELGGFARREEDVRQSIERVRACALPAPPRAGARLRVRRRRPGRLSEVAEQPDHRLVAEGEHPLQVARDEQRRASSPDGPERDLVANAVARRGCRRRRRRSVWVWCQSLYGPRSWRSTKPLARLPGLDQRPPAHRQAVQAQAVVDQRARRASRSARGSAPRTRATAG